ncbi:Gfo/Idh/MocA family protein [Desulfogranum japonicum]|uniref:Gfo/Idh/MocA family protein n=1 Tax=Desulfogranum japonicum TaxID=231447 RepID=UPI00040995F2|nr:Gfo/Idh/MocA family oxidoreductase [Desulfogranum japonicum]
MQKQLQPLSVGIIGTGNHGARYAGHVIQDCPYLQLAAISRRSSEGMKQAAQWNCSWYPEWQELVLDSQVDCVISVVPPTLNLGIARLCAQVGKPLLLEKPLAGSNKDAEAIVLLEKEEGLKITTGQTLRYNAVIQALKKQLSSVGTLYTFSANQRLEPSTLHWHHQPEVAGAGISFHTAVHVFDALRYITGLEVKRVMALTRQLYNSALEDVLQVLVEMEEGVTGTLDCSKVSLARSGQFEFICANGILQGEQIYNRCRVINGTKITDISPEHPVNTIVPLLRNWESFLRGSGVNPVTAREGYASVHLCQACLQSAKEQRWIDV